MFDAFKGKADQMKWVQQLLSDENFRSILMHPKFQELIRDPEVQALLQSEDSDKIFAHPKVRALFSDPELAEKASKLKDPAFRKFLKK